MDGASADDVGEAGLPGSSDVLLRPRDALAGAILRDIQTVGVAVSAAIVDAGVEFTSNSEIVTLISLRLDGDLRPRAIVDFTNLTRGGVTSMLDRMETSGLVRRIRGATSDRRGVLVELTDVGVDATDRIGKAFADFFEFSAPVLERLRRWFELGEMDPGPVPEAPSWGTARWLAFMRQVAHAGRALNQVFVDTMGDADPTPHFSYVTLWLARHEGGTRPKDISELTGLSSGGTTELLDRLEAAGLVVRSYGALGDHRAVLVTPTDEGSRRVAAALAAVEEPLTAFGRTFFPEV